MRLVAAVWGAIPEIADLLAILESAIDGLPIADPGTAFVGLVGLCGALSVRLLRLGLGPRSGVTCRNPVTRRLDGALASNYFRAADGFNDLPSLRGPPAGSMPFKSSRNQHHDRRSS